MKTLDKEEHNETVFSRRMAKNNDNLKLHSNHHNVIHWNQPGNFDKDGVDKGMVVPRENKTKYGNKFFIPGTTMRTRIEANQPANPK